MHHPSIKLIPGLGLNGIKLKWIIGTHGNWKNQNPSSNLSIKVNRSLHIVFQRKQIMFWSYQLDSTANPANLPQKLDKLAVLFSWCSSKTAPRILIFSITMGANYSFELISIETYAP